MFELTAEQFEFIQSIPKEGDWFVFKIMMGIAAGMILADYFIGIKEKKRMGFFDFIFVTIFLPGVVLTVTWPVTEPLVLSAIQMLVAE